MKKRLMVDMDDVITVGTFKEQIEEFLGSKIDVKKTGYYLQNALGNRMDEFFKKGDLDMYQDAPLMNDAYEVLEKLNEKYELYIVSAFHTPGASYQDGNHLKYKVKYLQKKLPFIKEEQMVFLNRKYLISFDIIIDDSIHNLESGKMKLLFSSYHNLEIKEEELSSLNIIRVNSWKEIADILL